MAPRYPRPQNQVLYSEEWTKAMDEEFIKQLDKFSYDRQAPLRMSDTNIIGASVEVVNRRFGTNVSLKTAQFWFHRLEKRHKAFGFATTFPGAEYDPNLNRITTNVVVWDCIYVRHNIAEAYMIISEPEWDKLCRVLGPPVSADLNNLPDIIQISDDSIEIVNANHTHARSASSVPRRSTSNYSPQQSLTSSFWASLEPIQNLSGEGNRRGLNRGRNEIRFGEQGTTYHPSRPNNIELLDSTVAPDSYEGKEEGEEDPISSQTSSSSIGTS